MEAAPGAEATDRAEATIGAEATIAELSTVEMRAAEVLQETQRVMKTLVGSYHSVSAAATPQRHRLCIARLHAHAPSLTRR